MKNSVPKFCLVCQNELNGRSDKKFCDQYCKSHFQYQKIKEDKVSFHYKLSKQLRLNRKILKDHNKAGKATVREETILELGFNPRIFTHYWKTQRDTTYLFVFEFGFQRIIDNNKVKYSIIKWQPYMNDQIGQLI